MIKKEYQAIRSISIESLDKLSMLMLSMSTTFQLIKREGDRINPENELVWSQHLKKNLLSVDEVTEWPGTKLHYGHTAVAYIFKSTPDIANKKINLFSAENLFEDVSFYRSDQSLILGSSTHENDIWLSLNEFEYKVVASEIPYCLVPPIKFN
jgi:hypothetical protein